MSISVGMPITTVHEILFDSIYSDSYSTPKTEELVSHIIHTDSQVYILSGSFSFLLNNTILKITEEYGSIG